MLNQTQTTDILRFIRCGVADETYGLDMSWVRSIQRVERLRRNPAAEVPVGWLPGDAGDIPVFSLARQLGRSTSSQGAITPLQRVIVLDAKPQPWALLVDSVAQVSQIAAERVVPLPPIAVNPAANYFQGVIKQGVELILLLSPERLRPDAALDEGAARCAPTVRDAANLSVIAKPSTPRAGEQRRSPNRIIVFSIAEPQPGERALSFGLSVTQVPEILAPLPLTPVPAAPAFVWGLVNWRDRPVPVIDLAARLGLAGKGEARIAPTDTRARLIITRDKGSANQVVLGGFLIRPAIRALRLPIAHQSCSRAPSLDQTLTRGIVELENETLVIPDIRRVFGLG